MTIPLRTAALLVAAAGGMGLLITGLLVALGWPGAALALIGGLAAAGAAAAALSALHAYRGPSLRPALDDLADRVDQVAARQVESTSAIRNDLLDLAHEKGGTLQADPQ
ncbi:hypothetical protein [Janibacter sp. GXQ6167]|uniref:hypothetical protein n=1 Tax=Janibacter sp. GXQ6167 TaxID=3240791 RepID=UPI0035232E12